MRTNQLQLHHTLLSTQNNCFDTQTWQSCGAHDRPIFYPHPDWFVQKRNHYEPLGFGVSNFMVAQSQVLQALQKVG